MDAVKSVGVLDADDIKTVFDALPSVQHEKEQLSKEGTTKDTISRQAALEKVRAMQTYKLFMGDDMILVDKAEVQTELMMLPAQPEDYTELKQEFLRMAGYIDVLLECSDAQKETLIGFISRLAEFMPWTERD